MEKHQNKSQLKPIEPVAEKVAVEIIRVASDAMEPQLRCGDVLFIERQPLSEIIWGKPYAILKKNNDILIRRIYKDTYDTLQLVADNDDKYPKEFILHEEVECILKIKLVERQINEVIETLYI